MVYPGLYHVVFEVHQHVARTAVKFARGSVAVLFVRDDPPDLDD